MLPRVTIAIPMIHIYIHIFHFFRMGSIFYYSIANKIIKVYKVIQKVINFNLLIPTVDVSFPIQLPLYRISLNLIEYAFGVYFKLIWIILIMM